MWWSEDGFHRVHVLSSISECKTANIAHNFKKMSDTISRKHSKGELQ